MTERVDVAIVGGGQAGLSASYELSYRGIEHVVLERGQIGQSWRGRWDSFCLVTPNWATMLPGHPYDGDDPDGYLPRDAIVGYLEGYAASSAAPVREGVEVRSLSANGTGFDLRTTDGDLEAERVIVATGAYQRPHRPAIAGRLPADVADLDAEAYRNPGSLPSGPVLVVGSGQTGCQIAEELTEAGREVFLACGRVPWVPRRLGDRDIVWWIMESGFFDQRVETLPSPAARLWGNVLSTGRNGGHDLHLRTLRRDGVTLLGHLVAVEEGRARFAPDLGDSIAWGDDRYRDLMDLVRATVTRRGMPMPEIPDAPPFDAAAPEELDVSRFGAVVFAGGFRPDYGRWVDIPGAFDELGFPRHVDGASTVAPGLYFVGVHFLRKRKSSLLCGVGEDAAIVARQIAGTDRPSAPVRT